MTVKCSRLVSYILLLFTILSAIGFLVIFYVGSHQLYDPLWNRILPAAIPFLLFFLFWRCSLRIRWKTMSTVLASVFSILLAAFFAYTGCIYFIILAIEAEDMPKKEAPRTVWMDQQLLQQMSSTLSIDLSNGVVLEYEDSHGGFHGDGACFITIGCEDVDTFSDEITQMDGWHVLPVTDTISTISANIQENYWTLLPYENGYYFFEDRHSEATDKWNDSAFLHRSSKNLTFALYDTTEEILYYYELDT